MQRMLVRIVLLLAVMTAEVVMGQWQQRQVSAPRMVEQVPPTDLILPSAASMAPHILKRITDTAPAEPRNSEPVEFITLGASYASPLAHIAVQGYQTSPVPPASAHSAMPSCHRGPIMASDGTFIYHDP